MTKYPQKNGWVYDADDNRASIALFGSREAAEAALDSLTGCIGCIDCLDCSYCLDCIRCTDCSYCNMCEDCSYCNKCHHLKYGFNCVRGLKVDSALPKRPNWVQRVLHHLAGVVGWRV